MEQAQGTPSDKWSRRLAIAAQVAAIIAAVVAVIALLFAVM